MAVRTSIVDSSSSGKMTPPISSLSSSATAGAATAFLSVVAAFLLADTAALPFALRLLLLLFALAIAIKLQRRSGSERRRRSWLVSSRLTNLLGRPRAQSSPHPTSPSAEIRQQYRTSQVASYRDRSIRHPCRYSARNSSCGVLPRADSSSPPRLPQPQGPSTTHCLDTTIGHPSGSLVSSRRFGIRTVAGGADVVRLL
jgi:hypothetical protein